MPNVPVTAAKPLDVTMQVDSHAGMKTALRADPGLTAPVQVGQKVGVLVISAPDFPGMTVPVYAAQSVAAAGHLRQHVASPSSVSGRNEPASCARTGRFITLEGGEGTGKSTQVKRLAAALEASGIKVVTTREPGGSPGAEEIRKLMVEGEPGRWDPITETLLVYAARADHVARTIGPALTGGKWVISRPLHRFHLCLSGRGPRAWSAKPSAASTARCWTISRPT